MSKEKKYPPKLIFQGTIDGVENPTLSFDGTTYNFHSEITDTFFEFEPWQIEAMPDKFMEPEPQKTFQIEVYSFIGDDDEHRDILASRKVTEYDFKRTRLPGGNEKIVITGWTGGDPASANDWEEFDPTTRANSCNPTEVTGIGKAPVTVCDCERGYWTDEKVLKYAKHFSTRLSNRDFFAFPKDMEKFKAENP